MYNQLGNYSNHYSRKEKVKNHWAGDCQRPNTPNRRSTSIIYLFNLFSCEKTALLCSPFLGSLCHLGIKYNYNKLTDQSFSPHFFSNRIIFHFTMIFRWMDVWSNKIVEFGTIYCESPFWDNHWCIVLVIRLATDW